MKIARKIQKKSKPKPSRKRPQSKEKLKKNRSKTSKNRRKIGFGRRWSLQVVPSRSRVARERAWDGLRAPSRAGLAAKLAVLAAMLAVLDVKLAARDGPNSVRSRPRALLEHVRKLKRRWYRFFIVFWYDRGKPEPQFSSASAVFHTLRAKLAPNARE